MFPLGDKHVLLISPAPLKKAIYFVGTYAEHKFTPETQGVLDCGGHFYAPQTMADNQGRRLMWGWLWEGRNEQAVHEAGWAGVMSLPRVLTLRSDGTLGMTPVPELEALRGERGRWQHIPIGRDSSHHYFGVQGDQLEIYAEFELGSCEAVGLRLRCARDDQECTWIIYDRAAGRLEIDRGRSSLDPRAFRIPHGGPLTLADGEELRLHIFVDRSVIEVYGNERACATTRVYPTRVDCLGVGPLARGGRGTLNDLDIWMMRSIW
jgi:beta-fructofuranosidase